MASRRQPQVLQKHSPKSKNSGVTGIGDDDEIADYDAIEAYEAEDEAHPLKRLLRRHNSKPCWKAARR